MPKQTPRQKRQAAARKIDRMLPVKPDRGGETVVSNSELNRIKRLLEK